MDKIRELVETLSRLNVLLQEGRISGFTRDAFINDFLKSPIADVFYLSNKALKNVLQVCSKRKVLAMLNLLAKLSRIAHLYDANLSPHHA